MRKLLRLQKQIATHLLCCTAGLAIEPLIWAMPWFSSWGFRTLVIYRQASQDGKKTTYLKLLDAFAGSCQTNENTHQIAGTA